MGKVKKRVQHLHEIAQIPRKNTFKKGKSLFSQKNDLVEWNEEFYEAEYQEEYEESRVELSSDESLNVHLNRELDLVKYW
ncbi:11013_t:CDS:2 [Entrophospora sp. SA101]|nr:11013_t:CDS:2 [Entrophospora sp. SA101]